MVTLGGEHGGAVGDVLGGGIAKLLGGTGSVLLGLTALLAGGLLLSGASYGAVLRRSHHAVRRAVARPERAPKRDEALAPPPALAHHEPPIDVVHDYPDVVSEGLSEPSPLLVQPDDETEEQTALFDVPRAEGEYVLPDRARAQGVAARGGELEGRRPAHGRHARDRRSRTSASRRRSSARSPARA